MEDGNRELYDQFRREDHPISRTTTDPVVAERTIKINLLTLPTAVRVPPPRDYHSSIFPSNRWSPTIETQLTIDDAMALCVGRLMMSGGPRRKPSPIANAASPGISNPAFRTGLRRAGHPG